MLISKPPLIVTAAPESCKVNKQYGVRDYIYVVICDTPTLGHVTRQKRFVMGRLISKLPLIVTAAP